MKVTLKKERYKDVWEVIEESPSFYIVRIGSDGVYSACRKDCYECASSNLFSVGKK